MCKDLSTQLFHRTNVTTLSQMFNDYLHSSYFDYINRYRIEHFKRIASDPANAQMTLIALSEMSGFKRSSFFNVFKKMEGCTPNEWITSSHEQVQRSLWVGSTLLVSRLNTPRESAQTECWAWCTNRFNLAILISYISWAQNLNSIDEKRVPIWAAMQVTCGRTFPLIVVWEGSYETSPTIFVVQHIPHHRDEPHRQNSVTLHPKSKQHMMQATNTHILYI